MKQNVCQSTLLVVACGFAAAACAPSFPPTVTPGPTTLATAAAGGKQVIEITMPPPGGQPVAQVTPAPVTITSLVPYRDPDGKFSVDIPAGWMESRQKLAPGKSDVKLGTAFGPNTGSAIITVTHFDNGKQPQVIGPTANAVLKLTGWTEERNYQELARENVLERPNDALRILISYIRRDGVPMHSIVQFQLDGTVFSMIHAGVEEGSWAASEGQLRKVLHSYHVPALAGEPSSGASKEPAAPAAEASAVAPTPKP